ncbi:MAG: hypothetical protein AAGJ34_13070 [Pseudomonadota bacterium]
MSERIQTAKEHYRSRFPGARLEFLRGFEDGTYVYLQVLHPDGGTDKIPEGRDLFEFQADGSVAKFHHVSTTYYMKTIRGAAISHGPEEVTDLDKTDHNKAVIERFFNEVLKTSAAQTRYHELLDPDIHWEKPTEKDRAFIALFEANAASFFHENLIVHSFFGGDARQVIDSTLEMTKHIVTTDYKLLIGQGNFVLLEYFGEGKDYGRWDRLFCSLEDGKIRHIF